MFEWRGREHHHLGHGRLVDQTDTAYGGTCGTAYAHDANGATTADASRQYAYDLRGRLVQATTAQGTVTYAINAQGLRVRKQAPYANTDIQFHYDSSGHLIAENPTGTAYFSREYVWLGDIPVVVLQ
jgi:YD repeat-containing protein